MAKFTFTRDYDAPLTECGVGGCRGHVAYRAGRTYELDEQYAEDMEERGFGFITDEDTEE